MSLSAALLITILIIGVVLGTVYVIIVKKLGIDSFSIFRRDLYGKENDEDEFYNRF